MSSHNKELLKGIILIDDHIDGNGQNKFDGQHIQFGTEANSNWQSVFTTLLSNNILHRKNEVVRFVPAYFNQN